MNNRSLKITFYSIVIFTIILFSFWFFFYKPNTSEKVEIESNASNEIKNIAEGNKKANLEILVFESFTCPHCAKFHKEIYPDLKKEFIDTGLIKIEFRSFPLDVAALNAAKIAHCKNDGKSNILHFLYSNQEMWIKGETIEQINLDLKTMVNKENFGIDYNKCINNRKIEDHILQDRIESAKKFKIDSTPTLIINNKKFNKPLTYKNLKKEIEKLI
tara:strand:- start:603 stop:1250 length:648 start_codon:yes stop_codon:yes gene_type:complete